MPLKGGWGGPTFNGKCHQKFSYFFNLPLTTTAFDFFDYSIKLCLILILDSAVASIGLASAQSSITNQIMSICISRSICICWSISILLCICICTIYIPDSLVLLHLLVCLEHSSWTHSHTLTLYTLSAHSRLTKWVQSFEKAWEEIGKTQFKFVCSCTLFQPMDTMD